jgi:pimeloyl-ACP methyl ester carboxylesterase
LRNVDLRPSGTFAKAYMHNGYFKTLSGLVHFYNTRDVKPACSERLTEREALARDCWPAPEVAANMNTDELGNLGLSQAEERANGALWNRSHPHFRRLALLGMLHIVWPRLGPERLLNNFIHRESFVDPSLAQAGKVDVADWLRPREGRTDWHRIARRLDYTPRLRHIAAPTLVLCGRYDPQFPLSCSEELARGILNAQLVVLERSGHFPFIEEPQRFSEAVGAFFRDTPAQRAPA